MKQSKNPKNLSKSTKNCEYDRGHLIGRQFGGSPDLDNLVRMKESVNRVNGRFYDLEKDWAKAIKSGKTVEVDIRINYKNTYKNVPTDFDVTQVIDGRVLPLENILN